MNSPEKEEFINMGDGPQVTLTMCNYTSGEVALANSGIFISLLTTVCHASGASRAP